MILSQSQKRGVFATVFFHTGVILLLIMFGLRIPWPPPPEQGILLDFGNSETGFGLEEPSAAPIQLQNAAKPKIIPAKTVKSLAKLQDNDNLLTQDFEKTVDVKIPEKKKAEPKKVIKVDEELKMREEAEKQKRLEEMEKTRLAETERVKKEQEAKTLGTINSRAKNAFGGGLTDNGSRSRGQGITYGPGNQGSPDGIPGANQFGSGGNAGNGRGNGTSFSLAGRSSLSLPKPNFPGNEGGIVVVEVTVNQLGKVTLAQPGIKGSNTVNPDLLDAARKAALSASFNPDPKAPAYQKGSITYHFVLQ